MARSHTHGCWLGWYEPDVQAAIRKLIKPGMTVWDLGANAGFYTLAFSRMVGPRGQVVAFEPSAKNAHHLLTHVRLNQCRNVVVYQSAVTAACGFTSFSIHERSDAMSHVAASPTGYRVPTVSVNHILAENPEWRPDIIKVDVEGAESEVLRGGSELFSSPARPVVLLSLHGLAQARTCVQFLREHEYQVTSLAGDAVSFDEAIAANDTVVAVPRGIASEGVKQALESEVAQRP